mmetsp:Transcript_24532/g.38469  ORF Transcript_24532/g.38469 Transcript_24532/m.38469 type:complete len:117 (+) Transcript_24532:136-486(+)
MLGVKHSVFKYAHGHPLLRHCWRRMQRFDQQTGLLTAGMPLTIIMFATISVTTVIIDRQLELRDMRVRTVSQREQNLEEEHKAMREFLKGTEDEYEMKQIPDTFRRDQPALGTWRK